MAEHLNFELLKEIQDALDERYVLQSDCNDKQEKVNAKFANDDKRIDRIMYLQENTNSKLNKNNWLTTAILSIILGIVVTMILKSVGIF